VTIYEPAGTVAAVSAQVQHEVEDSNRALDYYFAGDWARAEHAFQILHQASPERKLYGLYLERIQTLKAEGVGAGWDGVFRHTSK